MVVKMGDAANVSETFTAQFSTNWVEAASPQHRSWTSRYSRRRLGRLDSVESAKAWAQIMYNEIHWPVLWRIILLPFSNDRFSDIVRNPLCLTSMAYASVFPLHLTSEMIRAILEDSNAQVREGAIYLCLAFPHPESVSAVSRIAADTSDPLTRVARDALSRPHVQK